METSEVHHKIPLYPDTPSPDKTLTGAELVYTEDGDILEGIRRFLEGCGTVFCMPDNEEDCRGVLQHQRMQIMFEMRQLQSILLLNLKGS